MVLRSDLRPQSAASFRSSIFRNKSVSNSHPNVAESIYQTHGGWFAKSKVGRTNAEEAPTIMAIEGARKPGSFLGFCLPDENPANLSKVALRLQSSSIATRDCYYELDGENISRKPGKYL